MNLNGTTNPVFRCDLASVVAAFVVSVVIYAPRGA